MAAGSRKRRRPDGRTASPPLAPSPLLTRNLQLLPVGLTQLPNDHTFVSRLRHDAEDLLSTFAEALLLKIVNTSTIDQRQEADSSSSSVHGQPVISPFSIFSQLWKKKGWHLVQFTFADHSDSKRGLSLAICRALLEPLGPFVAVRNGHRSAEDGSTHPITFTDLKLLFKVTAIPFALYTLWTTQIVPTSGIGVKHCRPAMEHIAIEQDYYDWLLELPDAVLKHLLEETRTQPYAHVLAADLVEVVSRLVGEPFDENRIDDAAAGPSPQPPEPRPRPSARSKRRREWQDEENTDKVSKWDYGNGVFDIIPASDLATRLPRTWPSLRVMSSLEANKEFGRMGKVVRITSRVSDLEALPGTSNADRFTVNESATSGAVGVKETVAGLSRGDVVRLKARQRLAMASLDLSKLLDQPSSSTGTKIPTLESGPSGLATSDLVARITRDDSASASTAQRVRYEIETPSWITNSRYTAKMKPWLEETSTPMQQSLHRVAQTKSRYLETRSKIMPSASSASSSVEGLDGTDPKAQTDYGDWVLQSFRQQRRALQQEQEGILDVDADRPAPAHTAILPEMDAEGSMDLDTLYRVAAERAKEAAVQRGEMLKVRAKEIRKK